MLDYATIERIQAAAQIKDVVEDFVKLRKSGTSWKGLCPFHDDHNPTLSVSPARNLFNCFACGTKGTPITFVMKYEKLSYYDALRYLARKYNIEIKETELTDEQKHERDSRESMYILNDYAKKVFAENLTETEEGRAVGLAYFHERGFRDDIIKKFNLGYSLEKKDVFTRQALNAGYQLEFLEKTGLTFVGDSYNSDRFRGRVMFPIHSISGKTVGFGGRILLSAKTDKLAKYINSPDSEVYHKTSELYGIFLARRAIDKMDKCFLVEGYTDVISMHQAGIENVVAPCGTALTNEQIRLIKRFTNNITLLNDGDKAGKKATMKDIPLLLEAEMNVRIVILPEGEDPDSYARSHSATEFNNYITENETNFVSFKAARLIEDAGNDLDKKAKSVTEIVDTIALINDEITRLTYVKECSQITGYKEDTLIRRIAAKRQEIRLQKKKDLYPDAVATDIPQPSPEFVPPIEAAAFPPAEESDDGLDKYERSILRYIIRYGEVDMENSEEEQTDNENVKHKKEEPKPPLYTIEYVVEEFKADDLHFSKPLYRQIVEETYARYKDAGFSAETYFLNHPNPEIGRLALDLATDKYIESKIHSKIQKVPKEKERLHELVPYEVINYKNAILKKQIENLNKKIEEAERNNDSELLTTLIREVCIKNQEQKEIARKLRERIIVV
jgi:DNA primase